MLFVTLLTMQLSLFLCQAQPLDLSKSKSPEYVESRLKTSDEITSVAEDRPWSEYFSKIFDALKNGRSSEDRASWKCRGGFEQAELLFVLPCDSGSAAGYEF